MQGPQKIQIRPIESEMRAAYIDYSMSVIVSRALPDVRDGLKPVQRRVLYAMSELGLSSNRPTKKSARVVGEVLGKYHPHGDSAVYEAMVRMGQEWSLRYTLVEIQGNYGSIDGDGPAAMRYTEARLRASAEALLTDIDRNTVDFTNNFDDSLQEPTVLPAGIPNLLVNGASGIAVGMATNMAPHNLREVVAATIAYIDNREIDLEGLMQYVHGPDFPTGGAMLGTAGIREALATGRGRIVVRGRATIEPYGERDGREAIIIDEIPYQVNKSELVARIGELASDQKVEGIAEVRDESDKNGMRIVVALKNGTIGNVVLNNLYKHTALQVAFNVNNVCLVKGRPMVLNLKDLIRYYVEHRHEVVVRRTEYELAEARQRAHILEGLLIALDNLDEVIALIRASASPEEARGGLMSRFSLSEIQAKAILDMRLQRLTGLERDKIKEEYQQLLERIAYLERVLAEEPLRMSIIKEELTEVARRFGDERRTRIDLTAGDLSMEDMIANEEMIVSISHQGYIKRTSTTEYRVQHRGGMGARGTATKADDYVEHVFSAMAHDYLLLFTEQGRCYWLKVFEIPEGSRQSKGRAIQNLIQIEPGDKVRTYLNIPKLREASTWEGRSIIMCTEQGTVKKTELEAYSRPRLAGISAINITEGDKLLSAAVCQETSEIILASREGQAIRFSADEVREMGRTATGVRGIRLELVPDNRVVGMVVSDQPETDELLVVSEQGYGKRSALADYRKTGRGGKGVITLNVTPKTGKLVGIVNATNEEDLLISTSAGIVIRSRVDQIPTLGRNSQGVRLIKLQTSDDIAAVTLLAREEVADGDAESPTAEETAAPENGTE